MKTSVMKKIGAALMAVGLLSAPAFADKRLDDAVARAEDQIAKGKPEEALKTMQKAASQQPTSPEAQLALVESWLRGRAFADPGDMAAALHRSSLASAAALVRAKSPSA